MPRTRSRRLLTLLTAAAVLASLTAATVAAPASAAKPRCQGLKATIVGTAKGEVIRGTARRDIIVARGGNDRIYGRGGNDVICAGGGNDIVYGGPGADRLWGQLGRDRLLGNAGPDFLAGQVGDDTLVGGIGVDTCFQGTGSGPVSTCERPAPPVAPPSGPSLIPLAGILAVAYSDIDGLDGYSTGDVLISRLMDTARDGVPSNGDTVEMGRYPTNLDATAFADWGVTSHAVTNVEGYDGKAVGVVSGVGRYQWWRETKNERWLEVVGPATGFVDGFDSPVDDYIAVDGATPSAPSFPIAYTAVTRYGDDPFIDILLNYPVP